MARPRPPHALIGRLGLAALLLAALGACGGAGGGGAVRTVDVLVRDVLLEESFEIVEGAPTVGELCTSLAPGRDGADSLALLLAPPAAARFTVGDEGPCILRAAAGLSYDAHRRLPEGTPPLELRWEVRVNGELVFEHGERLERGPRPEGSEWARAGSTEGLQLLRGDVVELRTSAMLAQRGPIELEEGAEPRVHAGFAAVRLVHPRPVESGPATAEQPNLVVVLQDTQRRDRLGCYGYDRAVSPNLDALAARGTVYDQAFATSSWTWPSTASLLSGRLPEEHGVVSEASCYLDTRLVLLSEALQLAGYRTAGFSGSRLILPSKNFDQGFERFDSFRGTFRKSDALVPRALEWIGEHADERFFCYLHLVDTHAPHLSDPESLALLAPDRPEDWRPELFQEYTRRLGRGEGRRPDGTLDPSLVVPDAHRRYLHDLYDACVRTGDLWLGELVDGIDALGLTERTVYAFTSDHGEELFEHGKLEHGHTLHDELVRVPLVLAGPGVPNGERVQFALSNRHLAPTLARLGGAEIPGLLDGLDLIERPDEPRPVLFSTEHGIWEDGRRETLRGFLEAPWVLHRAPTRGAERLYDRGADPGELDDRAAAEPQRVARLRRDLEAVVEFLEERRRSPGLAADEDTLNMLEKIGYLDDEDTE